MHSARMRGMLLVPSEEKHSGMLKAIPSEASATLTAMLLAPSEAMHSGILQVIHWGTSMVPSEEIRSVPGWGIPTEQSDSAWGKTESAGAS